MPHAPLRAVFATTHWSVVLLAGNSNVPEADEALERMCGTYWYPLYAYVRRKGVSVEEAEDLTQEFFCRLLEKNYLAQVDPRKGRFRSFLVVAVNHFLSNQRDRVRAVKRGGRIRFVHLDGLNAEARYQQEPGTELSPERLFERRWATTLLEQVLTRLRDEFVTNGRADLFEKLKFTLTAAGREMAYADLADQLGTTEAALKMTVQRMRRRYAEMLREEIAHTVAGPGDVDDEIRHLFNVLGEP